MRRTADRRLAWLSMAAALGAGCVYQGTLGATNGGAAPGDGGALFAGTWAGTGGWTAGGTFTAFDDPGETAVTIDGVSWQFRSYRAMGCDLTFTAAGDGGTVATLSNGPVACLDATGSWSMAVGYAQVTSGTLLVSLGGTLIPDGGGSEAFALTEALTPR